MVEVAKNNKNDDKTIERVEYFNDNLRDSNKSLRDEIKLSKHRS